MAVSLPEKIIAVHDQLRAARIGHAFGGALALAYYAEPRATNDIDVNLFVHADRWRDVVDALESAGVSRGDLDTAALERDGQCRLWWGANPVDLFFSYDPLHDEMKEEARRVPFAGTTLPILSPEHLAVCKALFDRAKDWIDLEQILIVGDVDASRVEAWLQRMVGPGDKRLRRLRELQSNAAES